MKRIVLALVAASALAGCGIFKGGDRDKPKTPVLGDRIPVLASETNVEIDPSIADLAVTVAPAVANDSWSQPGGNPSHAMGHLALGQNLRRAWQASIPGSTPKERLAAAPVIADGKLFVEDVNAVVHAFALDTGAKLWSAPVSDTKENRAALFGGGVSYEGGKLFATSGLGDVVAMDASNGSVTWRKRPAGPIRGAPSLANGHAYVVTQDNQLFALNQQNGDTVWNESGTVETAGVFGAAAPAAAQGTVVAGFSSGELNAYRYENGRPVWQDALSRTSISTAVASISDIDADPVIDEGRVFAIGQGGRMVALELVTGQRLWEINIAGISTPWVAGNWVFVITDDARLLCVERTTGKVRWISQLRRWHNQGAKTGQITWFGPVLAGDRLIVVSTDGSVQNVSVADGRLGDSTDVGAPIFLPPVVAANTLVVLDNKGRISAFR